MLSLFRTVLRQPQLPIRALYSTASTDINDDIDRIQEILRSSPSKSFIPAQAQVGTGNNVNRTSQIVWKPFVEHSFIRPYQLTYKSRLRGTRKPLKRPTLGPGAKEARRWDVFYQLGLDPLLECQNPALLAGFTSQMGKIYGREVTGLTMKNQRRLGKAIRRARMMGVIPIFNAPTDLNRRYR